MNRNIQLDRFIAKGIDCIVVFGLTQMDGMFWLSVGCAYILLADGLLNGQSIGKRLVGLQVILDQPSETLVFSDYKHSIVRNLPLGIFVFLNAIPFLGWLFVFLWMIYLGLESYFIMTDPYGIRIGDIYARTKVIKA